MHDLEWEREANAYEDLLSFPRGTQKQDPFIFYTSTLCSAH